MMIKTKTKRVLVIAATLGVGVFVTTASAFAWTGPTAAPPANNTAAPLDTSASSQTKTGDIAIHNISASSVGATVGFCIGASCITSWPSGGSSQWTTSGSNIYYNGGNVGVGTASPAVKLEVNNVLKFTNSSANGDDGKIGTAPFAAGLNVVGINTDGAGRKVTEWGSIIQNENAVGNTFVGTTNFTGNVYFPGTANNFISAGTGDGATYGTYNFSLNGWWGMALRDYSGAVHGVYDFRAGSLTLDGNVNAGAFLYNSDRRLKKDIAPLPDNLTKLLALEPVSWLWKDSSRGTGTQIGFIAQDVQQVIPELVHTDALTTLESIDYARMTPIIVGSVQELNQKIVEQQTLIDNQQKQLDELETKLDSVLNKQN